MENKNTLGNAFSSSSDAASFNGASAPRNGRIIAIASVAALLILTAVGVVWYVAYTNGQSSVNRQFNNTNVDLNNIASSDFKDAEELTIIGQLNLDGGFAIKPSGTPTNSKAGQLYYDQTSNLLNYYNGTEYVQLSGDLKVGAGLTQTDGVVTNSGVLSVQGQTGDVTLTAGNGITISGTTISATGGGGVGGSGTTGRIAKFTGAQTLGNSLLTESGTTISVGGDLSVTGGLSLATALTVANGGTGTSSLTADGVLIGNGTGAITSVTAGAAGLCLQSTAGAPAFAACPGGGGGVTSLNGLSGALTLANASGVGSTVTIDNATTAAKGIASFNSTNFTVTSGAVNTIQDIATTSSPTFANMTLTGDLAVNGGDITSNSGLSLVTSAGDVVLDAASGNINMLDSTNVNGSVTARDSSTPTQQLRMRSTGGALDFESAGDDLHFSTWTGADFTGTQRKHLVMVSSGDLSVVLGDWDWYTSEFGAQHNSITGTNNRFNIDQQAVNFIVSGDTDANLLYVKGSSDSVGIGTSNPGFKLEVNGTFGVSGLASLTSLGSADTSSYLCRNSSNQIATCSTTGTGVAFVQGGNSFGGTAILGTNDNQSLTFETNNTTQATIAAGGSTTFQNSADSTSAFAVKTSLANNVLVVDTANARVGVGAFANTTMGSGSTAVGLNVSGAVRISGSTNFTDIYTTPAGGFIGTRLSIENQDLSNFQQMIALGITAASSSTARGISVLDARASTHQPSIAVFSPNENTAVGFTWNGSNTAAYVQTMDATSGSTSAVLFKSGDVTGGNGSSGDVYAITGSIAGGTGGSTGVLYLLSGNGAGTDSSSGNIVMDVGSKTGTGSTGNLLIGTANATDITIGRSGLLTVNGGSLRLNELGATNTTTYLCLNGSTTVSACNTTGAGVAFINDGNSLSGTATLGTNDSNALNFETNNTTRISISSTGDITIGTSDTTGSLLVLDTKTNGGDPSGTNGAMYYNSALAVMRCYVDGYWRDCIQNERTTYSYVNDFVKVPSSSAYDDTLTVYGEYFNVGSATYLAGHPGVLNMAASTNGNKTAMTSGSGFENQVLFGNNTTWRYEVVTVVPSLSDGTERFVYTSGFNDTTDTISGINNGCYFRYSDNVNSGNWQGVCEDGTESTCDTAINVTADQWYRLTIVVNDAGTSVDFRVDGVSKCTIATHIPSSTTLMSFESIVNKTLGNALRGAYVDYLSVRAQFNTPR